MSSRYRSNTIGGNWVAHRLTMRESLAWRALPDIARRVLDRLEVEHMRHAGRSNGALICTYTNFHQWGIRRGSIFRGLAYCVAFGFLEVTHEGRQARAEYRTPAKYRLTYVMNADAKRDGLPTDEWSCLKTPEDVVAASKQAEAAEPSERPKKRTASAPTGGDIESGSRVATEHVVPVSLLAGARS